MGRPYLLYGGGEDILLTGRVGWANFKVTDGEFEEMTGRDGINAYALRGTQQMGNRTALQ
jgi:hypothetical protein